jgi:hypothetical protein
MNSQYFKQNFPSLMATAEDTVQLQTISKKVKTSRWQHVNSNYDSAGQVCGQWIISKDVTSRCTVWLPHITSHYCTLQHNNLQTVWLVQWKMPKTTSPCSYFLCSSSRDWALDFGYLSLSEIWSFDGGEDSSQGLLGCTLCSVVVRYQHFKGPCCLCLEGEDGSS